MDTNQANQKAVRSFQNMSDRYGYLRSIIEEYPVDKNGCVMPAYTYPAYEFLSNINFKDATLVNYLGATTAIWWATRAKSVFNIEVDQQKHWIVGTQKINNLTSINIFHDDTESYNTALESFTDDITIISMDNNRDNDGVAKHLAGMIKAARVCPMLIIINDAAKQIGAINTILTLEDYIKIDFTGLCPASEGIFCTSIFLHRNYKILSDLK